MDSTSGRSTKSVIKPSASPLVPWLQLECGPLASVAAVPLVRRPWVPASREKCFSDTLAVLVGLGSDTIPWLHTSPAPSPVIVDSSTRF